MLVDAFCTLFEARFVPINLTSYGHFRKKLKKFDKLRFPYTVFDFFRCFLSDTGDHYVFSC